jgi:hypothetical protein
VSEGLNGMEVRQLKIVFYVLCLLMLLIGVIVDQSLIYPKLRLFSPLVKEQPNISTKLLPKIEKVSLTNISTTTADVNWVTNKETTSKVIYCPIIITGRAVCQQSTENMTLSKEHSVHLTNLDHGTVYDINIQSADSAVQLQGNQVNLEIFGYLKTNSIPSVPDNKKPEISNISDSIASKNIVWNTDEPTKCQLIFWSDPADKHVLESNILNTAHSVTLDGIPISAKKTYYYLILATDLNGNTTMSDIKIPKMK